MSSTTVAFFGATGGVTNAVLVHTLLAGYKAAALVRNPQKLRDQLTAQGLDASVMDNLAIVQGNALDVAAVKRTLAAAAASPTTGLPTFIVTGLGGAPHLRFNWRNPFQFAGLDNPTICESAAKALTAAMREIYAENPSLQTANKANKPLLTFVSTTGITRGPEDVPFWMRFLYHQILTEPHIDKRKMENEYRSDLEKSSADSSSSVFRSVVGIRPTLLTGGADYKDSVGLDKIRSGTEANPALGYTVKRADVGLWVFVNVINESSRKPQYEGEMITLTS